MKIVLRAILVLTMVLAGALLAVWVSLRPPPLPDHQVFLNGNILTVDARDSRVEAMSLRGDRIEALGSNADIRQRIGARTVVHDLRGKTVLPGFIDAHGHFPGTGLAVLAVDLNSPPIGATRDIPQLQRQLRAALEAGRARGWLLGFGYDDTALVEGRHPTRAELDAVSREIPILLMHISGHMSVVNSAGLAAAGIDDDTPDPEGGVIQRDADGSATGLLQETAAKGAQAAAMDFGVREFLTMTRFAAAQYLARGVTLAQSGGVDSSMLAGLKLFKTLGLIPQRLELFPLGEAFTPESLREAIADMDRDNTAIRTHTVKLITDGSIQGYTGYLSEPYHTPYKGDVRYRGFPTMSASTLRDQVIAWHGAGFQLALHGNGDAAIDAILDAIAAAQSQVPREDVRHILIHAQMARRDQLERMQMLGVTPSFFSAHTYYWGDRHRDIFMGPIRAANMSPTGWAQKIGLRYSVHLDAPVVPMDPLLLLWSTVTRESSSGKVIGAAQRVSVTAAIRAMTIDAAWQIHREDQLGSLEPGKLVDLVILSDDPTRAPETIRDLVVEQTWIGGRRYFAR